MARADHLGPGDHEGGPSRAERLWRGWRLELCAGAWAGAWLSVGVATTAWIFVPFGLLTGAAFHGCELVDRDRGCPRPGTVLALCVAAQLAWLLVFFSLSVTRSPSGARALFTDPEPSLAFGVVGVWGAWWVVRKAWPQGARSSLVAVCVMSLGALIAAVPMVMRSIGAAGAAGSRADPRWWAWALIATLTVGVPVSAMLWTTVMAICSAAYRPSSRDEESGDRGMRGR